MVRHRFIVFAGALLAAAALAAGLPVWTGANAGAGPAPEGVWRSIFARPALKAADDLEARRRALGLVLFADPRLSRDGDRSCATCHRPQTGFTDGLVRAKGRDGSPLQRNTPHLYNLADAPRFLWDGRVTTLEAQARGPLHAENELAADFVRAVGQFKADPDMRRLFAEAYPAQEVSEETVIAALAAYTRSLISPPTAFDAWMLGDDRALNANEVRGFRIFVGKGGCVSCHGGWRMTDDALHDIGLPGRESGQGVEPGGASEIAGFKTPGLRQVAKTAPYMHDGSKATLEEVVAHYAGRLVQRPSLAPTLVRDLELNAQEQADLVAFLKTL